MDRFPAHPITLAGRIQCRCGVWHLLPSDPSKPRFECGNCGEVFYIPRTGGPREALAVEGLRDVGTTPAADSASFSGMRVDPRTRFQDRAETGIDVQIYLAAECNARARRTRELAREMLWSILFLTDPRNLKPFMALLLVAGLDAWIVLSMPGASLLVFSLFAVFAVLFLEFLQAAYLMSTLDEAACGSPSLPSILGLEEMISDWPVLGLEPVLALGASVLMAVGPGAATFCILWARVPGGAAFPLAWLIASAAVLLPGVVLWPILVLIAAHGQIRDLFSPIRIARTLGSLLIPYSLLVIYVLLLAAATLTSMTLLLIHGPSLGLVIFPTAVLLGAIRLVGGLAIMRGIGVFSRIFREELFWED